MWDQLTEWILPDAPDDAVQIKKAGIVCGLSHGKGRSGAFGGPDAGGAGMKPRPQSRPAAACRWGLEHEGPGGVRGAGACMQCMPLTT